MSDKATPVPYVIRAKSWTYVDAQQPNTVQVQNTKIQLRGSGVGLIIDDNVYGQKSIINFERLITIKSLQNSMILLAYRFQRSGKCNSDHGQIAHGQPSGLPYPFNFSVAYKLTSIKNSFNTNELTWNNVVTSPIIERDYEAVFSSFHVGSINFSVDDQPNYYEIGNAGYTFTPLCMMHILPFPFYGLLLEAFPSFQLPLGQNPSGPPPNPLFLAQSSNLSTDFFGGPVIIVYDTDDTTD